MAEFDGSKISKIRNAMKQSFKLLRPFREKRLEMVEQFVGSHYGEGGARKPNPMGIFPLTVNTYARSLYARNPQVKMSTPYQELKPIAAKWQLSINKLLKEIDMENEASLTVLNALMSFGVMKVGLHKTGEVDIDGQKFPIGMPYAKVVDLDDWVHDTCAKRWEDCAYYASRSRYPLDWVKANTLYDPAVTAQLNPSERFRYTMDGGEERVQVLSSSSDANKEEYVDYVDLWEVYLHTKTSVLRLPRARRSTLRSPFLRMIVHTIRTTCSRILTCRETLCLARPQRTGWTCTTF